MRPTMNDFVAETKGHCFLCSSKISCQPPSSLGLSSTHSLYGLSRYLRLDMKKAFTGGGPIPPDLVARLEKSKLRAELCQECGSLTKSFSKLIRRLEKAEMEVASCLGFIQGKLEKAVDLSKTYVAGPDPSSNLEYEWTAKLEITEALRKDAVQKCSRKLGSVLPVTKLQNLSLKQVATEKRKLKLNSEKGSNDRWRSIQHSESDYAVKGEGIGSPLPDPDPTWYEDGGSDHLDEHSYQDSSTSEAANFGLEYGKLEGMEPTTQASTQISLNIEREEEVQVPEDLNEIMSKSYLKKADELNKTIPPPIKVAGEDVKPQSSFDPQTGKYKCLICAKEYRFKQSALLHHKSAHVKVKYKCKMCKNDFKVKHVYETHYLNIHMGVKFKCGKCNKTFTQKGNLKTHQKTCVSPGR